MAKTAGIKNKSGKSPSVRVRASSSGRSETKFGSVVVTGSKPSATSVRENVKRSSLALERVTKKLVKPGVFIRAKSSVPQYSADEDEPGVFIRRLGKSVQRGRV